MSPLPPKPDAFDFMNVESLIGDEERAMRDSVRTWAREKALPVIRDHHRAGTFPEDLIDDMAELGLLGASLQGYGCAGVSALAYGLMMAELEYVDSGLRSFASVQGSLAMYAIHAFGSEEQKQQWLPLMARGQAIGCFGLTEPDSGSDPGSMRTKAEKTNKGWLLNGIKRWITNGTMSDVAVVWAKTEAGIRGFLVPGDCPGFSAPEMEGKFSMRASVTSELILEEVHLAPEAMLPGTKGLGSALACLNQARYSIVWGVLGAARACYEEALRYARERKQFDTPLAGFQLVQAKLVEMLNRITQGQLLALRLAQIKDEGKLHPSQVSLAKMNNVRMALDVARLARDILGANGIVDDYVSIRHMLNLETVNTYEGTEDIHRLILGETITGIGAFR